ncbi:E3 ubiquitin-protein ligase UPL2-like isoform X1 [Olea europaea var. sylvestris]|uniref:E3 ubiquitin-protein ligase UPL2-like isoform X1 n=1 Tax=Olea europaea var. sylvestris TaxID=158386 RepID=UPI000C1D183D|nr:E3 ubiquitin-protein ligase UPL2-like isoform X1 [Olea europaea var. sylvestris]
MASVRSSLPSRLRQLLSSEGAIGPSVKLDSEPPPRIKAFIDKVIQCPLQDIAIPLSGFRWEFGKGNFHHWRPLFMHFDTYFKTHLSNRNDLLLSDNLLGDVCPFPKQPVLQILRVMQFILENCHNKGSFSGLEHFRLLLASTDPEIVVAALETLSALVKIIPSKLHANGKLVGCGSVNSHLLSLAQGWGTKEEGLGLYSCVTLHERTPEEGLNLFPVGVQSDQDKLQYRIGSALYFELHGANSHSISEPNDDTLSSGMSVINLPDLHLRKEDDLSLMKLCIDQYNVPAEHRFSLLTRIRYAHALRSPRICRIYSKICLLSFIVLVQSGDSHDELVSFFANEPEYSNELIRIVRSEEIISGSIRTFAMTALGALLAAYSASHERARILSGSSISFAGGNRTILLNVLQRAILSLKNSSDLSSLAFVEALLQFYMLHVMSSSSTGSIIRGSGMVPTFLPLLEDSDLKHVHLVYLAVKTLQKLMDYSNTAVTLFKDLGGVELLVYRLQIEVQRVIDLAEAENNTMTIGECNKYSDDQFYAQKRLIRALLKALGSATYAAANSSRSQNSYDVSLTPTLLMIFSNMEKFGGEIYSSAVTLMSEMIHKDPTCFNVLHELGLPAAFLSSVSAGILPSSKAITCILNGLGAICLNAKGLEAVRETSALRFLIDIFTDKRYVMAMNEGIVPLANALEELLRHVSALRGSGVDLIIEIVNKIALLGESTCSGSAAKENENNTMVMDSMDSEDRKNLGTCSRSPDEKNLLVEGISDEQFMQLCIFHVMVLVHRTIVNSETCRLFVEKSGIEALFKLLLRPSITQSTDGMSIALHSTLVFKSFTQHHSVPLARAFCSTLRDHLKRTLTAFSAVSASFLLEPKTTPDSTVFSSLSLVEFLLFLAASKDNRWVTALLTEFGNGSKDVLEDMGFIQREVLWQIAQLEDAKVDTEVDFTGTGENSPSPELSPNDTEEHRLNTVRRFLDPSLRRRTSGWSFESQFFDLINLYRDLSQQRQNIDGPSSSWLGASHESPLSTSSDGTEMCARKDNDKQKSYYHSCCDMVRSLSIHITHLFQELGKVMLLPSRRRDDMLNVSAPSKSVASTFASIALDHMNFGGHANPSGSEISVSTKCRYFGKVINFIDGMLLDKPDSCNPVLLNFLYGQGVIQSVLTTFEATSQLLFAVNRTPASPMETDEGRQDQIDETDSLWIYGPLASYGKLMDHLVTSSFILSPFTKHLLTQPLVSGGAPFPRDAETFVKILHSMVLKALLPVWTHPQFPECSYEFIARVVNIVRHIFSGVEVKNVNNNAGRVAGPPPNESTISMIVEMGFSRSRAEEALRQVGSDSVELAMEWLFSHPEEIPEDDELARALAMSLGNAGSNLKEDAASENSQTIEEELVQLPPVDELLATCRKLLQMKDSLAFPVRDLLMMICSQNEGQQRPRVISFIIEQVKLCGGISDSGNRNMLSSSFHVLALILNEDSAARELASKSGLVKVASDLLSLWNSSSHDGETSQVPKWVTSALIALDRLSEVDIKLNADILELLKKNDVGSQPSLVIDDDKQNKLRTTLGILPKHLDIQEQNRLVEIICGCMRKQLPSETMHAALQLCSTLTRNHSVAVSFLEAGGLRLLLSLPTTCLFVGFDNVAAIIIRHILEDSQTLQQAMESEIRHSVATANNRQSTGRLTPRNFLSNLISVIQRDPVIFMQAAKSVCHVEMVGDRPYIVLLKDRDKDKCKERGREKEKNEEKDKQQINDGKSGVGSGHGKHPDTNFKNFKIHRKPPQSFVSVIDLLLDSVISFLPPLKDQSVIKISSSTDMDIDVSTSKGKGKGIVPASEENEANSQDSYASMAKIVFILKLLTDILLMYASSIHILIRKDAEVCSYRGIPQRGAADCSSGGIFQHVLYKFLPYSENSKEERKMDVDWRHKLASRANQFLVASCVRSSEARKRIFTEINNAFNDFVDSSSGFRAPGVDIQALACLLNDVLAARSPTGSSISAEASVTFIEAGLVQSFTRTLRVIDLDHADSPKVVTGLLKVLESVTKEHIHAFELNTGRGERLTKPTDNSQPREDNAGGSMSQSMETTNQANENSGPNNSRESSSANQIYGGSEAVTDDMEHDQDIDGSFAAAEDDYMHENSENIRNLENSLDTVGIRFEIRPNVEVDLDDEDDDEMSGDEGDQVDEDEDGDDEQHNDLEDDEPHHLPHVDTDHDDHENDEDEFDEEIMEEEDDDDEDDEDAVILRLGEEMNGINVFDHIELFGRDSFSSETLHVMPVEIFGSRRQGRSTSIYNLMGRNVDSSAPSQHPLLVEPPSSVDADPPRHTENVRNANLDRNLEGPSSQLNSFFRTLRNGRQGHRFNLWTNENQLSGGSNLSAIPPGLEDFLVSSMTRPIPEKSSNDDTTIDSQNKGEVGESPDSAVMMSETPVENHGNVDSGYPPVPSAEILDNSRSDNTTAVANESVHGAETSSQQPQSVEMQYDHSDVVRDVEAVSQESSGSGATLGESLRSLDVEIGSADGHDDSVERQGGGDTRMRRPSVSFGNNTPMGGRDASLRSVTEVSEDPIQEAEQGGASEEQHRNDDADSRSIDPAFLDALPVELRAEVLSAQQNQALQPQNTEPQNTGDIDPEFLAALPPDIREEVLTQQRAQRLHQSQELEGQPVEMDTVSIIATFPSDIREEVLLTSSDAILANLTPALVAEANMLRERFARRYNQTLFGMHPRNRRGESSRRGDGSDRAGGLLARRSMGSKLVEADGSPLVDTEGLKSLIRLLRVVQPLYKSEQRLLLNLCAHVETRTDLVKILMDLLLIDKRKSSNYLNAAEAPYRLYACQSHVMYSRPQNVEGVPPLVSRRVLETLTYLARNHPLVAKLLLELQLPQPSLMESPSSGRGKAVMVVDEEHQDGHASLALLLSLLSQSLYLRSIAHLEQLLNLLDVIIGSVESKLNSSDDPGASSTEHISGPPTSTPDAVANTGTGSTLAEGDVTNKALVSGADRGHDTLSVLLNLPLTELRLLCSLLSHESLSDNAYTLVAEVLRKLVSIAPVHCHLFITELAGSLQSLTKCATEELQVFGEVEKALLTSTTSHGPPVFRVLQALSSLVVLLSDKDKNKKILPEEEQAAAISVVGDINVTLEPLWQELSNCISKIESHSDTFSEQSPSTSVTVISKPQGVMPSLPAGAQNILPYIESFFVTCEKLHPGQSGSGHDFGINAVSDVEEAAASVCHQRTPGLVMKGDEKNVAFIRFSEKHRKLLNVFIRQNPGLLEKTFSLMLKVPRFIDFDNKRAHFRSKIKHQYDHHHSPLRISVRRAYILEDSYNQLRMRSAQDLKGRLTVHFQGEEGIDAGGLTREWYQLLSRVIFDKGALLFTTVGNESTFQPNPNSAYQTEHLSYFKFVGRVVGKALLDGQLLDVHFTRSFYKHILGVKVTYHDIEAIDPDYFKNLKWMLENDISDVLDLTFSIDADEEKLILYERTEVTDYELIPGGRNIRVTEENKHQYVDLVAEHRLTTAIRPQINAFLEGFNELISRELISIFNDKELELLISGLPDIDLDDLRANTEYSGYTAAAPVIQWFWEVVQGFSKEDKARLLQFVTGTSKVPLEGFSALQGISGCQKFQIHKAYVSGDHLPSAHTCFNQLDLPEYPSKQHLEERLLVAIHEGNEGFGFG